MTENTTTAASGAASWDGKLPDSLQRSLNALRLECPPAVVNHLEHEVRSHYGALYTSLDTVKRMYGVARDRLEEIDAALPDPFAAPAAQEAEPDTSGNPPDCDPELYAHGVSVGLFDVPKWTAEALCKGISAATGARVDWHYVGGRVHVKALPALPAPRPQADAGAVPAVPEGWRLLPAKATQEILDAIRRVVDLETSDPEDHRYDDGTSTADALYEALLAAAPRAPAAPATPNCARCQGSGEDPEGYYDQSKGDAGHTNDGPCRGCSGTGEAPAAPTAAAAEQVSADEEAVLDKMVAKAWDRFEAEMERLQAPAAGAAPTPTDAELPDVEDMAHSALQEALSFGLGHDVLHRWMRAVMDKTVKALAAAPAQAAEDAARYRWLFGARTPADLEAMETATRAPADAPQDAVMSELLSFYVTKPIADSLIDAARARQEGQA